MSIEPTIREAATVALLRDGDRGLEVLLLRRAGGHVFAANAYVFAGGAVDAADDAPELLARCVGGLDYARACLGATGRAPAYWLAAIREGFEEAGVLVGCAAGLVPDAARRSAERATLNAGRRGWRDVAVRLNLRFALDALVYFACWQTPPGSPRRYATRFFAARAPADQSVCCDGHEVVSAWWASPGEALACRARGEIKLLFPTRVTLEALCGYPDTDSALAGLSELGLGNT